MSNFFSMSRRAVVDAQQQVLLSHVSTLNAIGRTFLNVLKQKHECRGHEIQPFKGQVSVCF